MQTECLVRGSAAAQLTVRVRFLHVVTRNVAEPDHSQTDGIRFVAATEIDGELIQAWQEAVEREIVLPRYCMSDSAGPVFKQRFRFAPDLRIETLKSRDGRIASFLHRQTKLLEGMIEVSAMELHAGVYRVTVGISNLTQLDDGGRIDHDTAVLQSLVSAHTILDVAGGSFVSLLEPPEDLREAASRCRNVGTWPVLAGAKGEFRSMLSSPIILYDYPEIAQESPGELFDGTEIDEILTLRIMTMTDQEKEEMRHTDERARRILERTESLPQEHLAKLHGALRGLHLVTDR